MKMLVVTLLLAISYAQTECKPNTVLKNASCSPPYTSFKVSDTLACQEIAIRERQTFFGFDNSSKQCQIADEDFFIQCVAEPLPASNVHIFKVCTDLGWTGESCKEGLKRTGFVCEENFRSRQVWDSIICKPNDLCDFEDTGQINKCCGSLASARRSLQEEPCSRIIASFSSHTSQLSGEYVWDESKTRYVSMHSANVIIEWCSLFGSVAWFWTSFSSESACSNQPIAVTSGDNANGTPNEDLGSLYGNQPMIVSLGFFIDTSFTITCAHSSSPTSNPSGTPSRNPTCTPTYNPTLNPTIQPTNRPTMNPTMQCNYLVTMFRGDDEIWCEGTYKWNPQMQMYEGYSSHLENGAFIMYCNDLQSYTISRTSDDACSQTCAISLPGPETFDMLLNSQSQWRVIHNDSPQIDIDEDSELICSNGPPSLGPTFEPTRNPTKVPSHQPLDDSCNYLYTHFSTDPTSDANGYYYYDPGSHVFRHRNHESIAVAYCDSHVIGIFHNTWIWTNDAENPCSSQIFAVSQTGPEDHQTIFLGTSDDPETCCAPRVAATFFSEDTGADLQCIDFLSEEPSLIPTLQPTKLPTIGPSLTISPTNSPTFQPTANPTISCSYVSTFFPTHPDLNGVYEWIESFGYFRRINNDDDMYIALCTITQSWSWASNVEMPCSSIGFTSPILVSGHSGLVNAEGYFTFTLPDMHVIQDSMASVQCVENLPTRYPTMMPSVNPTRTPSSNPTASPSQSPTGTPTWHPTRSPTISPSRPPSTSPTLDPTLDPVYDPTRDPSEFPSIDPTQDPIPDPTFDPTANPSVDPTVDPTTNPTLSPTLDPTQDPLFEPTSAPTINPSADPSCDPTADPSFDPTRDPTMFPSVDPSQDPTLDPVLTPTEDPTQDPVCEPTLDPTEFPSLAPSLDPTQDPVPDPTYDPTADPSADPTVDPSYDPTFNPFLDPTKDPSFLPTMQPSIDPSLDPTKDPSLYPSLDPSTDPSRSPSLDPTQDPAFDPTLDPTKDPSRDPSLFPSMDPSFDPTHDPILDPTKDPSFQPTFPPSIDPSLDPTKDPSLYPSLDPSTDPSESPSLDPTQDPVPDPTFDPTADPSIDPTVDPSTDPIMEPSLDPTQDPVHEPTFSPTINPSADPSCDPTADPSFEPTRDPTMFPSADPSQDPTLDPVLTPTEDPTQDPICEPTLDPTEFPSLAPSLDPTQDPVPDPTYDPTADPSLDPTRDPSLEPTNEPTSDPTEFPSLDPSSDPTIDPIADPTFDPTADPSADPTVDPSLDPSMDPTFTTTDSPSMCPTYNPTTLPTSNPSIFPTYKPSKHPSFDPTEFPSLDPSFDPTVDPVADPTFDPTADPSADPTIDPSSDPSMNPTFTPTNAPTINPTNHPFVPTTNPTINPTKVPSVNPTVNPTNTPSKNPSNRPTNSPTIAPTSPTKNPTKVPSKNPTTNPTKVPSKNPSTNPTKVPSKNPTTNPTKPPSKNPSMHPTREPTAKPSLCPSQRPTLNPIQPTHVPTQHPIQPTNIPTQHPIQPTNFPTKQPSLCPTANPTDNICEPAVLHAETRCTGPMSTENGVTLLECQEAAHFQEQEYFSWRDSNGGRCDTLDLGEDAEEKCFRNPNDDVNSAWTVYEVHYCTEAPTKNPTGLPTPNPTLEPTGCQPVETCGPGCRCSGDMESSLSDGVTVVECHEHAMSLGMTYFSYREDNMRCRVPEDDAVEQCVTDTQDSSNLNWSVYFTNNCESADDGNSCPNEPEVLYENFRCSGETVTTTDQTAESCQALAVAAGMTYFAYRPNSRRCHTPAEGEDDEENCVTIREPMSTPWNVYMVTPCTQLEDKLSLGCVSTGPTIECTHCKCEGSITRDITLSDCESEARSLGHQYFGHRADNNRCILPDEDSEKACVSDRIEGASEAWTIYQVGPCDSQEQSLSGSGRRNI